MFKCAKCRQNKNYSPNVIMRECLPNSFKELLNHVTAHGQVHLCAYCYDKVAPMTDLIKNFWQKVRNYVRRTSS
jgi:NADH:ubiquinone oxidoreductase subunit F (NADH-binding)